MFQRLPTALTQVKVGHRSGNLLEEIRQIVHALYLKLLKKSIEGTGKKVYNKNTIFMNSKNIKTSYL